MASKYPKELDQYTTKQDVTPGLEETTGNYVEAEHVNSLQDAVVNIEKTLGTNPQGSVPTVSQRIALLEDAKSLKTPSICIYLGNPLTFNGANTVSERLNEFLYYNNIVFGNGLEEPTHTDHEAFRELLIEIKKSRDVSIYGYINVAPIKDNDIAIANKIALWNNLGVSGLMLDNFGYDQELTRTLQNHIVNMIHSAGLGCLIRATYDADIFASEFDQVHNPNQIEPILDKRDAYLHEVFAVNTVGENPYTDTISLLNKCKRLTSYRYTTEVKLFATALIESTVGDNAQSLFNYAQAIAIMYSYDAFYATTENFGSTTNSQRLYNNLSLVGNYYDSNPQVVQDGTSYYRIGSFGKIIVDTINHIYTLEGVSIPGETVFGSLNYVYLNESEITGGKLDGVATELIIINSHQNLNMYDIDYMDDLVPSNTISDIGLGLHQEMSDNGTLTYTLSWTEYTQGELPADFLLVFWKEGENVGQPLQNDNCYAILTDQTSYTFYNFISEKFYNFGIASARRVGKTIKLGEVISPIAWQNITQGTPDFNWSLDGKLAEELKNIVYKVEIISSNGITFKNNSINTILQAKVYHGADDITDTIDSSRFQWTRTSSNPEADTEWNFNNAGGYKQIEITNDDVFVRASFTCTVIE